MVTLGFIITSAVSQKPRNISVMKSISADLSRISENEVLALLCVVFESTSRIKSVRHINLVLCDSSFRSILNSSLEQPFECKVYKRGLGVGGRQQKR